MRARTPDAAQGLSTAEATRRLRESGPNRVVSRASLSVWVSIGRQLRDPLIVVLLVAFGATLVVGDIPDAAIIALVVVANSAIGVAQELRADRAVTALSELTAPTVSVRRDGREATVSAVELVPGDVVVLREGDIVPADGTLRHASALLLDESALTGESVPVAKHGPEPGVPGEELLAGTVVARGRAVVEITATGDRSALGRIAALVDVRVEPTPLQRRLAGLGKILALTAVALSALVLILGLARGEPTERMVVAAISLAVAAVPESLPAVVTLSLALGARRMARRNAIVRRLPAVETLGSITVLATDKTGTLTEGRMLVREASTLRHSVTFAHGAHEPPSGVSADGLRFDRTDVPDLVELLTAGALCNDANLVAAAPAEDASSGLGDPTEVAMLVAARRFGIDVDEVRRRYPRVDEVPFDSSTQRMTTVHRDGERLRVVTKGSPEALVALGAWSGDEQLEVAIRRQATEYAASGSRVLAVASSSSDTYDPRAEIWRDLAFLGLIAIADPPKPTARSIIDAAVSAGITPVLITGDHPATARSIARQVGILGDGDELVLTGGQIEAGHAPDLTEARVFARTTPEQKFAIVNAWRNQGEIVAMTGDGVNDGPALRRSDIGVAMGHRGTEVARQAADLVLADDDLRTVVAAVEEGRRIYGNIRRFLVFGISGGLAAILVMLLGPLFGLALPLLAAQILWINLLTHGLTGVAMGAEPVEPGAMRRGPRPPQESVLGDGLWQRVLRMSVVVAGVALGVAVWGLRTGKPWQSMLFVALTSLQLGVAIGLRPRLLIRENVLLPAAVAGSLLCAIAGVYVPVLRELLGTVALPLADLSIAVGVGAIGWIAIRIDRAIAGA